MIKLKKTFAKGYFLFQGKASANSSFIEDLREAKEFIILANYYFKGYLKIHEYLLCQDGWNFIVKIHSLEALSKKVGMLDLREDQVWRIISERMRIFLSRFVKYTNRKQGRTGSKVHSSYERFIFETLSEAQTYIEGIRKGYIKLHQKRKKYRAKRSHYMIPKKLGKGSIFISSRKLRKRMKKCSEKMEVLELTKLRPHVLRNLLDFTYTTLLTNIFHQNAP